MTGHCRFYQVDEVAKAEHEDWMASLPQAMKDEMEFYENQPDQEGQEEDQKTNNFYPECSQFCKFLRSDHGYPGEYITGCTCPGNEHILDVDFRINEII